MMFFVPGVHCADGTSDVGLMAFVAFNLVYSVFPVAKFWVVNFAVVHFAFGCYFAFL